MAGLSAANLPGSLVGGSIFRQQRSLVRQVLPQLQHSHGSSLLRSAVLQPCSHAQQQRHMQTCVRCQAAADMEVEAPASKKQKQQQKKGGQQQQQQNGKGGGAQRVCNVDVGVCTPNHYYL